MLMSQALRRIARSYPDRTAIVEGELRRTWREFEDRVARLAGALRKMGVGPGDRVAILAGNSARFAEFYYAVFWIGAVAVPLNWRLSPAELIYTLNDSEPETLFIGEQFLPLLETLRASCASIRHVVLVDGDAERTDMAIQDRMIANGGRVEPVTGPNDWLACLSYTSGTTGMAKGVMLSHAAIWASTVAQSIDFHGMLGDGTIFLHCMPLFHTGGASGLFATTIVGGTHIFLPEFTPAGFLETLERERATHSMLVPTLLSMVLDEVAKGGHDLSSLRTIISGGAPLPEEPVREAQRLLPHIVVSQAYGQTEFAPYIACMQPEMVDLDGATAGRLRSVGRAGYSVEVIIADDNGVEVPRDTVGQVLVRGPNMMTGYWRKPEETAATIRAGWVHTGDGGYMDADGFLYLVDRIKDMIVTGGENVYSSEVENALASHPAVAQCAVFGIPDPRWGEAVHAEVMLRAGATASESDLVAHVRSQIAAFKCPRSIAFRTEPFPIIGLGKILKRALREEYLAARETAERDQP